jgi:hypothetical protein
VDVEEFVCVIIVTGLDVKECVCVIIVTGLDVKEFVCDNSDWVGC